MNFLLFLLVLPNTSALLSKLAGVMTCGGDPRNVTEHNFKIFFEIPLGNDEEANFEKYAVIVDKAGDGFNLTWPNAEKIDSRSISPEYSPKVCCHSSTCEPVDGQVYWVKEGNEDMDVYHYINSSYHVEAVRNYTTIFSRNDTGSTLKNFQTDKDTSFQIFSGLVGENDTLIYTYESGTPGEIYLPEPYFYINNTGSKTLNFTVENGAMPFGNPFDSNGLIATPGYPHLPPSDEYKNAEVKISKTTEDKMIRIKVTSEIPTENPQSELIVLADDRFLTVTVGTDECEKVTSTNKGIECTHTLTTGLDGFSVKSEGLAYIIEFDIEEIPTTTTTLGTTITTKSTAVPEGTCPPVTVVTCPPVTNCSVVCPVVTCPTVTTCVPSTSTTEVPTTTMGASTTKIASLFTLIAVYCTL